MYAIKMDKTEFNAQVMTLLRSFAFGKKLPAKDYDTEAIIEFIKIVKSILSMKD